MAQKIPVMKRAYPVELFIMDKWRVGLAHEFTGYTTCTVFFTTFSPEEWKQITKDQPEPLYLRATFKDEAPTELRAITPAMPGLHSRLSAWIQKYQPELIHLTFTAFNELIANFEASNQGNLVMEGNVFHNPIMKLNGVSLFFHPDDEFASFYGKAYAASYLYNITSDWQFVEAQ